MASTKRKSNCFRRLISLADPRKCQIADVLKTMRERVAKFNVEKIKPQDLAGAAGPLDDKT